ncbi:MAG: hypothetical protein HOB40_02290 [Candidatus Marinimicrobia bacterium]|jgi:hypothetical protein|nr:hypothetical protein [Candidatus Neomarinimicrobiota bacterium]MBT3502778.1 hypothetical protein [Candidatus Neomarinimicrobiota bacterium]MBT3839316.1 hypothetical protein [Candidatus Neomarinimicrobiota bacterium]MBT3999071.1 hypothetical protein [Candidatus Neomarinimicrobiota bacterium]MBT4282358.1 hypothetical protein [Candidatus Neomarinimicrobiota bacterium]
MIKFLTLFLPIILFGQFDQVTNGFGLDIGSNGSGIFVTRNYIHNSEKTSLNGEIRFYDIKADDETIVYDYYTGQYKTVGGKSLVMFPAFVGINYYPFVGKIENNFAPFVALKGGMVTTIDGDEYGTFSERWKNPSIQYSPGGFVGLGIDFKMISQSSVMVMVGIELLPLTFQADGKKDYSGVLIHLAFNRPTK